MKQVFIIQGGNSFNSYESYVNDLVTSPIDYDRLKYSPKWFTQGLAQSLTDFDVLTPSMPNKQNAVYDEWKIVFEKLIPHFGDDVQLIGHSLGAMFLAKYLNSNTLPKKVRRVILVSGGYNDQTNEKLGSFEVLSASGVKNSTDSIHLFHSKDDFVVPFSELAKFQADLSSATSHIFEDRGHFLQPDFPELYTLLKQE